MTYLWILYINVDISMAILENPIRMPWLATSRLPSDEERLLSQLFSNYNPSARPVMNSSKTVPVAIQFSLMHIKDLVSCTLFYHSYVKIDLLYVRVAVQCVYDVIKLHG